MNNDSFSVYPEMDLEFYPTNRGKDMLYYKMNTYVLMHSKTRWYCSKRHNFKCEARVITTKDRMFLQELGVHNHPPPKMYRTSSGNLYAV